MQIHELNNYNGDLNGSAFMAIDNGEDTGKISVVGLLADVNKTVNELGEDLNGRIDNIIAGGDAPSAAEVTDARRATDGIVYPSLGDAIRGQIGEVESEDEAITRKLLRVESDNLLESDLVMTSGYVAENGTAYASATLCYTPKLPVNEGDVLRGYCYNSGAFAQKGMRFVCAYDASGTAVPASGAQVVNEYTVPAGIRFVTLTLSVSVSNTQFMVTKNKAVSVYEAYFAPYYLATEDFIRDAMGEAAFPEYVVKGYNLLPGENGEGYYFGSSVGTKVNFASSSSFHYAVLPVKPNTRYYVSKLPRFLVLTDDDDIVISFADIDASINKKLFIDTGSGTKLYYSLSAGEWNNAALYGSDYQLIIAEGDHGTYFTEEKPSFVSDLSQNMTAARYGCALPRQDLNFTVGLSQKWYLPNILALKNNIAEVFVGSNTVYEENDISILAPSVPGSSTNSYKYRVFDSGMVQIAQQPFIGWKIKADNLQDCSALVIGDSTVAQLVRSIYSKFVDKNKNITFFGTRDSAQYKNEGRSGWSAKSYCTVDSSGGVTNPFYNPVTEEFDFTYYMANQGYSSIDFVVIQLGINDLYNRSIAESDDSIIETAGYILSMIDSILNYNPSQKILLNLPVALNSNPSTHKYRPLDLLRNIVVRYNDYVQFVTSQYSLDKVRCSYCHLILNPDEDIADAIHPNAGGYAKMAEEVVSQINCWQN